MAQENNHYARLGIPIDATPEEVRRAYREAARRLHPDANSDPHATELFLMVQESYEVLSDPEKRAAYDATLPPDFSVPPPITLGTLYSRATLPRIGEPQLIYALLEFLAHPDPETKLSPPLNIGLVLDVSTSMQGPFLDTVKNTAIELIHQLKPGDSLSLVTFSDRAEVLLPAGTNLDSNEAEIRIRMLQTGGGTEIFKGLMAGFAEVQRLLRKDYVNHILLLTDGRTYGDEVGCMRIAQEAANLGIGISTFGIGNKWNDVFLDSLASCTGGSSMLISKPKDITQFLRDKFSGLIGSYADRVSFNFTTGPGVDLRYAFRLRPEVSVLETQSPVQMGRVPVESSTQVLLEFYVQSAPAHIGQAILAEGHLTFDVPSRFIPTYTMRLRLDRPTSSDPIPEAPPPTIVKAMSKLTLYRMQEKVQQDLDTGNISAATRRLQYLATHLFSKGERDLASEVMGEAVHIQQNHQFSEAGWKRIKYGTRGLLLPEPQHVLTPPGTQPQRLRLDGKGEGDRDRLS
jgi:Ca-activated chloride channel family protein